MGCSRLSAAPARGAWPGGRSTGFPVTKRFSWVPHPPLTEAAYGWGSITDRPARRRPEVSIGDGKSTSRGRRVTKNRGAPKAPPSAQKLGEMVERLQRDVTESSAKTDWQLALAEALEKEISSLRADLTRITQRGNEEWQSEARSWFEVHAELLATKVEELSTASDARLTSRARRLSQAIEERADDVAEQARSAAAELARAASERRLSHAEQQLAQVFASAKADLDRRLSKILERRLTEIAHSAEAHVQSAVRDLGKRLGARLKDAEAHLAAENKQRLTTAEKKLREAAERAARKRENQARRAEDALSESRDRLVAQLDAESERVASTAGATSLEFEERVAQIEERLLDRIAEAEAGARGRLLALAEELTAEIVVAEQAQQRERAVHREARKVAAGLEELRNVSRRASRRRGPGAV
jgi:hypothetical protein